MPGPLGPQGLQGPQGATPDISGKLDKTGDASGASALATGALVARLFADRFRDTINALDETAVGEAADIGINRAIAKASDRGGGRVVIPNLGAVYSLSSKIVLKSNVQLLGLGRPVLKLAAGVNSSVIESDGFQALTGTNSGAGIANASVRGLIVDGNRAQNTAPPAGAGYGVAIYGRDFIVEDVVVRSTARRGLHTEYGNGSVGTSPFNVRVERVTTDTTGEEGWWNGVSDLHFVSVNIRSASQSGNAAFDGFRSVPGVRGAALNVWSGGDTALRPRYGLRTGAGSTISGGHIETSATAAVVMDGNGSSLSGLFLYNNVGPALVILKGNGNRIEFTASPETIGLATAVPVVLGETGDTPIGNTVDATLRNFAGSVVNPTNSGGGNIVTVAGFQTSGAVFSATPTTTADRVFTNLSGGIVNVWGGRFPGAIASGQGANAGNQSAAALGTNVLANGIGALAKGANTTAQGSYSEAGGLRSVAALYGVRAHAAGRFATDGDAQVIEPQWRGITTDATPTELFLDGAASRASMPANASWVFDVVVTGRTTAGGSERFARRITGMVNIGGAAGTINFPGAPASTDISAVSGFDATVTADTATGALKIAVTGIAGRTVRWHVRGTISQVTN